MNLFWLKVEKWPTFREIGNQSSFLWDSGVIKRHCDVKCRPTSTSIIGPGLFYAFCVYVFRTSRPPLLRCPDRSGADPLARQVRTLFNSPSPMSNAGLPVWKGFAHITPLLRCPGRSGADPLARQVRTLFNSPSPMSNAGLPVWKGFAHITPLLRCPGRSGADPLAQRRHLSICSTIAGQCHPVKNSGGIIKYNWFYHSGDSELGLEGVHH